MTESQTEIRKMIGQFYAFGCVGLQLDTLNDGVVAVFEQMLYEAAAGLTQPAGVRHIVAPQVLKLGEVDFVRLMHQISFPAARTAIHKWHRELQMAVKGTSAGLLLHRA